MLKLELFRGVRASLLQPVDCCPIAFTLSVMTSFEETIIMTRTDHLLDHVQFAYRPGRGVDDVVATLLNYVLCHLKEAKLHARVLYLDMNSAFNTLLPNLLYTTLIPSVTLNLNCRCGCRCFGGETPTSSSE